MSRRTYPAFLLAPALAVVAALAMAGQVVPLAGPAATWQASCAYCHEQGVGPVLGGRRLPPVLTATLVRQGIRGMPAFHSSEIDDTELAALARWVEDLPAPRQR